MKDSTKYFSIIINIDEFEKIYEKTKNEKKQLRKKSFKQWEKIDFDFGTIIFIENYAKSINDVHHICRIAIMLSRILVHYKVDAEERKQIAKEIKEDYKKFCKKTFKTIEELLENSVLRKQLNLAKSKLQETKDELASASRRILSRRIGDKRIINKFIMQVFFYLDKEGLKYTEKIDFIYLFFKHFNIEDYGKEYFKEDGTFIRESEQKDRIRQVLKDQKNRKDWLDFYYDKRWFPKSVEE